ncbi:MAG: hypothetical protein LQ342_003941 [Letrouitia transgressa]|nr:MAG: hypothetical protein LQ342_003941 [Letrouitia transgressa]
MAENSAPTIFSSSYPVVLTLFHHLRLLVGYVALPTMDFKMANDPTFGNVNDAISLDTDLKIQSGNPPVKSMKEAIARNSDGKFEIGLQASLWKLDNGQTVNIDAVDSELSPYVPGGFVPASSVNSVGDLPYISKPDLLVSKLISCNERVDDDKATKDARDAFQVVVNELAKGGISLTRAQKDAINRNNCMDRVYEVTCTTARWWERSLGLQT